MLQDESNLVVNCPGCGAELMAPRDAAGRKARCKQCDHKFVIPATGDLMEDTISGWISEDIEQMYESRERDTQKKIEQEQTRIANARQRSPSGSKKPKEPKGSGKPDASGPADGAPDPDGVSGDTFVGLPVVAAPTPRPGGQSKSAKPSGGAAYPASLTVDPDLAPHLVVERCDTTGVHLRFDARWLKHEGFRASMPVRCTFSGIADRTRLIARPLLFMDRCQERKATADQVIGRHENRVLGDASPREIVRKMGVIERMAAPFQYAMPYYVSNKYAHLTLHAESRDRRDGGVTCDLLIPDGVCALAWLASVNGMCGPEHELLERDVSLLHGEAWRELSEECRQRLAVWCKLAPREVFRLYLNDADFGRRDEGLAGLIVTDRRVAYCKYHHRGQVRLDEPDAAVRVKSDGRFAALSLAVGDRRTRMIKINLPDVERLAEALRHAEKLKLVKAK